MTLRTGFSAAVLAATLTSPLTAQRPVTLPGTERISVTNAATGVEYRIDVALPPGYATSGQRYPVFYVLDGNLEFALAMQAHRMIAIDGSVPELIIVGVGYPEDDPAVYTPAYATNRTRDYTPNAADDPVGGKAPAFLAFLKDQLVPTIDSLFRTDPTDRGLGGHSLGGLFTTYVLLHDPTIFRRYWIASPSLWWDRQIAFTYLTTAAGRTVRPAGRAFLSVGALESDVMVSTMQRMAAALTSRFPDLKVESQVYPDELHLSVVSGAISRAFRVLYGRPTVPIAPADARAYVGSWAGVSDTFSIALRQTRLIVSGRIPGFSFSNRMLAHGRDELFDESFNVPYLAERDSSGRVVRFKRVGLGSDSLFHRVR